jgi:hypothetical protein
MEGFRPFWNGVGNRACKRPKIGIFEPSSHNEIAEWFSQIAVI